MEESLKVTLSFPKLVCLAPESCFNNVFNAQMIDEINS